MEYITRFLQVTAFGNWSWGNLLMDLVAIVFIYLAIKNKAGGGVDPHAGHGH